jgi:hypothetical protein
MTLDALIDTLTLHLCLRAGETDMSVVRPGRYQTQRAERRSSVGRYLTLRQPTGRWKIEIWTGNVEQMDYISCMALSFR